MLFISPQSIPQKMKKVNQVTPQKMLKKLAYLRLDEIETAESNRTESKGPTFAFSTCTPC